MREPEEAPRGVFMRRGQKYFSGVTQFQADKAAEMIKRESQNFSRVYYTMGRGDIGVSKYDQGKLVKIHKIKDYWFDDGNYLLVLTTNSELW